MATEPSRPRARRAWLIAGALILGLILAPIVAAPRVPAICSHILDLSARAGEPVGPAEREACEDHYRELRSRRGVVRWTWMSWCTKFSRSFAEAGEC